MDADGRAEAELLRQFLRSPARRGQDPHAHNHLDPGPACGGNHFAAVGGELFLVEMGVGVNEG